MTAQPRVAQTLPSGQLERSLLLASGNVTRILEGRAGEPIVALKLRQSVHEAMSEPLGVSSPERLLERRVVLSGSRTRRRFLFAESLLAIERLPPALVRTLLTTTRPLGPLLADHAIPARCEILSIGRGAAGDCSSALRIDHGARVCARSYRLMSRGRPIAIVRERFPEDLHARLGPLKS